MENSTIKVLIGDDTAENGVRTASGLREMGMNVFTRKNEESSILGFIANESPDAVILDLSAPNTDVMHLMAKTEKTFANKPSFIIMSDIRNAFIERQIMEGGASYFITKPCSKETLASIIKAVCGKTAPPDCTDMELLVTNIIQKLGIPAHVKGYHYLRSAILSAIDNSELMDSVTKFLYPSVARQYSTTSSRVERAIRHAIEIAWDRGDSEVMNGFFGYTSGSYRGRPTNSEFIAFVTDKLRLQRKQAVMSMAG